jgi:putative colanic acid biosynthesis acetyltransferase WcaF
MIPEKAKVRARVRAGLWHLFWTALASWTPPMARAWRRWLLRRFGATIDPTADVYGSATILHPERLKMEAFSNIGPKAIVDCTAPIVFEKYATISQGVRLCTKSLDPEDVAMRPFCDPIRLGKGCWVAADCFVGPGVNIGDRAVLGAAGVTFENLEPGIVYVGDPARPVRRRGRAV